MDTVVVTRTFEGDIDEMVAFCRSMKSRENWPGAVPSYAASDRLVYNVGMRLKSAEMTDLEVDEKLSEVEHLPGGAVRFSTANQATWPTGHASASSEYLFTPGGEESIPNTLQYTYQYDAPSTKLVKTKALPAFRAAMEMVVNKYVKGITNSSVSA